MLRRVLIILCVSLYALIPCACSSQTPAAAAAVSPSPSAMTAYRDGIFEYQSGPDAEGYFVKGTLTVAGGKIASAEWAIYDANRNNKVFDKDYESVFSGNETYMQQCRDNLSGMAGYAADLVETQSVDEVDTVTGATWAYQKFNEFAKGALGKAE